jgi:hypothetical protein
MTARRREPTVDDRDVEVESWRFEELVRAGYPEHAARELSRRTDVDLHLARELMRRNCPPELAVKILA